MIAAFAADVGGQKPETGSQKSDVGVRSSETRGQKPAAGADSADDVGEEAVAVSAVTEASQSTERNDTMPPPDEEGYVWPEGSAAAEATATNENTPEDERAPDTPLPSLDELVKRIPTATRDVLDELFRAKFVTVKRVEKGVLKN